MRVLEDESRNRLGRFNQKDVSMVFSSVMRLHPSSPHPLVESCLSSLERHLEKERHPQTLFLLLSYYRLRAQALQGHPASDQQLINNRKILRLVRHTLGQVSAMREHELALLDEMLALCAQEANNKALEAIFSSQLFYENRQERFIRSMAGEGSAGGRLSPPLVAASCACAALRLLPTLWSRWVHPAPCRGPVLQCRQPKQEVLCAVPTISRPQGAPSGTVSPPCRRVGSGSVSGGLLWSRPQSSSAGPCGAHGGICPPACSPTPCCVLQSCLASGCLASLWPTLPRLQSLLESSIQDGV